MIYVFLSNSLSIQAVNGVQATKLENGLSTKEDTVHLEDIIHLTNHGNSTNGALDKSETSMPTEPILSFESEESFMKKAGPMKPQHAAGTELQTALIYTSDNSANICNTNMEKTIYLTQSEMIHENINRIDKMMQGKKLQ